MRAPFAALFALALTTGCATFKVNDYASERQWRGADLPPSHLDVEASEIEVTGFQSWVSDGNELRNEVATALRNILRSPAGAPPGRFRVRASVQREKTYFLFFPCLIFGMYFGCPFGEGVAVVDLDYQAGARILSARGEASVWQGMYYNSDMPRAAIARALGTAVNLMAEQQKKAEARR